MTVFKKNIFINAPLEEVYQYTINPENWSHFYNGLSEAESIKGDGEVGTIVKTKYSMLGIHFPVTIEVTACDRTSKDAKWSSEMTGGFPSKQTSIYVPKDNGTQLTFEIDSGGTPNNLFGKIIGKLVTDKMEENSAMHTLENIKAICEGAPSV